MEKNDIIHIGHYFQEYTKYKYFHQTSDMVLGKPVPEAQQLPDKNAPLVNLPNGYEATAKRSKATIAGVFRNRRSRRKFTKKNVTIDELAALLWSIQGAIEQGYGYSYRTSPSAGARHPLETYINLDKVTDVSSGLYRYLPLDHKLVQLSDDQNTNLDLAQACLGQQMFVDCAVSFIWTARIYRSSWKYQQRAYRYIYLDAGHVCQNLYLACEALKIGCCAVAAFDDDAVNQIIGVDGQEEFVIYLAVVGHV